ncbi:hypothetical protein MKW92_025736, partial [Papaver armeniacum]
VENFGDRYVNRHLDVNGQMRNPDETFFALNLHKEDSKDLIALSCVDFQEEKEKLDEFEKPDRAIHTRNMVDWVKSKEKKKQLADKAVEKGHSWTLKDAEKMLTVSIILV